MSNDFKNGSKFIKNHTLRYLFCILIIMVIITISFSGCFFPEYYRNHSDDKIYWGFNVGPLLYGVRYYSAVKSPIDTFNIDNVTLDFYFGFETGAFEKENSLILYVVDNAYLRGDREDSEKITISNYKNVKGFYFIDEIPGDTIINGPYDTLIRFGPKSEDYAFRFMRTYTIPAELFTEDEGLFYYSFATREVFGYEVGECISLENNSLILYYKKLENGKIKISNKKGG